MESFQLSYSKSKLSVGSIYELAQLVPENAVVITDQNVAKHWGHITNPRQTLVLPAGESTKSFSNYQAAVDWVASIGVKRSTPIVAFGGGVIGDLAGFVAASYMRGVPLIQIPTTLLAQVDSSVGGKVGIDLPQGKNLLGAFYHPQSILIATDTLKTLDPRQVKNGLAEVWKYGFILDASLVDLLTAAIDALEPAIDDIVMRCIKLKEQVVLEDEFDLNGRRAILNFGHTIGHALEAMQNYAGLLHGEAVAVGMVIETRIGEVLGVTPKGTEERIRHLLEVSDLPVDCIDLAKTDVLIEYMSRDKKATATGLSFSLLEAVGRCKLVENVPVSAVREALQRA